MIASGWTLNVPKFTGFPSLTQMVRRNVLKPTYGTLMVYCPSFGAVNLKWPSLPVNEFAITVLSLDNKATVADTAASLESFSTIVPVIVRCATAESAVVNTTSKSNILFIFYGIV